MATATIGTTNWTLINAADSLTGWSNIGGGAGAAIQTDVVKSGTGAIGRRIDAKAIGYYYDLGAGNTLDFTGDTNVLFSPSGGTNPPEFRQHIGFWVNILQPDLINGMWLRLTDGVGSPGSNGADYEIFPKNTYNGGWYFATVDPAREASIANGITSLDAIRYIGFFFDMGNVGGTLSNCIIDAIYRGTGITITGGSTSDKLTFDDVEAAVNNPTNSYGLIQKRSGVFFMRGGIEFGDSGGSGNCYFEDSGKTCVWTQQNSEDNQTTPEDISAFGEYFNRLSIVEGTGVTDFINGTKIGSGDTATGFGGCTYQAEQSSISGAWAENRLTIDFSNANVTNIELYGCTFRNAIGPFDALNSISFCADATNGPNHELAGCIFGGCGRVGLGRVVTRNCTFSNTKQSNQGTNHFDQIWGYQAATTTWVDGTSEASTWDYEDQIIIIDRSGGGTQTNSAVYFGYKDKFAGLMAIVEVDNITGVWEYWDGTAWSTITAVADQSRDWDYIHGSTKLSETALRTLVGATPQGTYINFTLPVDWERTSVNSSESLFFVRRRETVNPAGTQDYIMGFAMPMYVVNGAALAWNANINIKNSNFVSNADADTNQKGHGIEHRDSGTFSYSGLSFTGNDADILFSDSTGNLTINASDGAPSTSTVTGSGSVIINNTVDITLTGLVASPATEVRVYEAGTTNELAGQENVVTGSFTFQAEASDSVDIVIHNVEYVYIKIESFTIPSSNASIPIQQRIDRNYNNP